MSMATPTIRIVFIEDQHLLSASLGAALRSQMGAEIVGAFTTATAALKAEKTMEQAQVALVDIRLDDTDAFELVEQLRARHPSLRLIWVTGLVGDYVLQRALDARLPGFVHKSDPLEVLVAAITAVAAGHGYMSESILQLQNKLWANQSHFNRLISPREQEVLRYIGCGMTNDEAGILLKLRPGTIHSHRRNIMAKLKLHTAGDLMAYAVRNGFSDPRALKTVSQPLP